MEVSVDQPFETIFSNVSSKEVHLPRQIKKSYLAISPYILHAIKGINDNMRKSSIEKPENTNKPNPTFLKYQAFDASKVH